MKVSLVKYIVCPICKNRLKTESKKNKRNEIIEGHLICVKKHKFPILNGVPRLVVDKSKNFIKTENAFSLKWKNYNKSYHDKKWYNIQRKWFLDRFGWKNLTNFKKFLESHQNILDAGTGVGNSAHLFSSNTNANIFAIDASDSIEFAYKKYGKIINIHFLQADIRNLPFKKNFFDFICSDQVLHHTKNTQSSFKYLTRFLHKDGFISIYVYKKKGPIREFSDDYLRKQVVNRSEKESIEFSKDMALLGKNLSKLKKKIKIPRDIPLLKIKAGTYDLQLFFYWNFLKCWWSPDVPFEQSVATNFDWYYPKFAYRHTPEEVRKWYREAKIKIVYFNEIESGISVSGKKST